MNLSGKMNLLGNLTVSTKHQAFALCNEETWDHKLRTQLPPLKRERKGTVRKWRDTILRNLIGDRQINLCRPQHKYALK